MKYLRQIGWITLAVALLFSSIACQNKDAAPQDDVEEVIDLEMIAEESRLDLFELVEDATLVPYDLQVKPRPVALGTAGFPLVDRQVATIYVDEADWRGVMIAAESFAADVELVADRQPEIITDLTAAGKHMIIAGTIEHNALIQSLVDAGKLDIDAITGKWESYVIERVQQPFDGIDEALVIAGSDKRGAIYGLYKLSEAIGVSPWVWWADVTPEKKQQLLVTIAGNRFQQGEPSVRYRGIFLNNENPSLLNWVNGTFKGFNSDFYQHVFELILRLKGNYLWPAMWGKTFFEDDKKNPQLADDYGIVMGTSHHEPMMRSQKDWGNHRYAYGDEWNYATNAEGLYAFWEDGIIATAPYEKIVTIGMRGDGDMPMMEGATVEEHIALLTQIIADQREILAKHINEDVTQVPQVWTLYKEVEEYYHAGMPVPDDVILMLTNDNFGNVRTLPTDDDRDHPGGFGMYYHLDYVGGPRSYKWLNTVPLTKIWEQMTMAYDYGVDQIWIVNVGDLKPMELPMQYFLDLAYDMDAWGGVNLIKQYTYEWAHQQFGAQYAGEIAPILSLYTKYNGRRKPEAVEPDTYSATSYNEAQRVLADFERIAEHAALLMDLLPEEKRDAFYQLVLYPTKASMIVNRMQIYARFNELYARQGRAIANVYADLVREQFNLDAAETYHYNKVMAGGKWDGMMSQAHIGQTSWEAPEVNVMPKVTTITVPVEAEMIIGVPNKRIAFRDGDQVELETFTNLDRQVMTIEIANGGANAFEYTITPSDPFIVVDKREGMIDLQNTFNIAVDFEMLGDDIIEANGSVTIEGAGGQVELLIKARKYDTSDLPKMTFIETRGYIAIEAEHYANNVAMDGGEWTVIDDYGRTLSALKVLPNRLHARTPGVDAPYLEYYIYVHEPDTYGISLYVAPTNNLSPQTGMRYAISVDDDEPRIIDTFRPEWIVGDRGRQWAEGVLDNIRISKTRHHIEPGLHTIRIYMVDAGLVLQKIVIDKNGNVLDSYLGPEETYYVK